MPYYECYAPYTDGKKKSNDHKESFQAMWRMVGVEINMR